MFPIEDRDTRRKDTAGKRRDRATETEIDKDFKEDG